LIDTKNGPIPIVQLWVNDDFTPDDLQYVLDEYSNDKFSVVKNTHANRLEFSDVPQQEEVFFLDAKPSERFIEFETRLVGVGYDGHSFVNWDGAGYKTNFRWRSDATLTGLGSVVEGSIKGFGLSDTVAGPAVGGVYVVDQRLADEEERGTLNFEDSHVAQMRSDFRLRADDVAVAQQDRLVLKTRKLAAVSHTARPTVGEYVPNADIEECGAIATLSDLALLDVLSEMRKGRKLGRGWTGSIDVWRPRGRW
jgi:hypothetical protein